MKLRFVCVVGWWSILLCLAQLTVAQTPSQTASTLPHLVRFSGTVKDLNGNPLTGVAGITFALYSDQSGGAALWLETQNVTADSNGHYTVLLGATKPEGLPEELFTSEQAHWVGAQVSGQAEQPRVRLVSAPYALKAGDAETVGGLPPSAFVLAPPASTSGNPKAGESPVISATTNVGGSGTTDYIPLWTSGFILGDSVLFQSGSGSTAAVGINTTTPAATLDVNGIINSATGFSLGGNLFDYGSYANRNAFLGFAGNSTTTGGFNTASGYQALLANTAGSENTASGSYALSKNTTGGYNTASGYDALPANTTGGNNAAYGASALQANTTGSNNTAGGQGALLSNSTGGNNTAWGASTLVTNTTGGNNTALGYQAGPSAANLNYATAIGANALVSESNAMVLGGTGAAAVNVGIGTATPAYPLDVAGIIRTSTGGIQFPDGTVQTTAGGAGTITGVTAGTDLTGGGTSGNVTLNLDTTKVPQLASANAFTGNQTVNGNLSSTGIVSGSSFQIGSNLFDAGSYANENVFLGFAGSSNSSAAGLANTASGYQAMFSNTGSYNAAHGAGALFSNTTGGFNAAGGYYALSGNTTGSDNTAFGYEALLSNATGFNNTAIGYRAGPNTNNLSYATAIGANATVSESNAMVLGGTGAAAVNVGIGTATPAYTLDAAGIIRSSSGGFKFPDGTVQTTAASGGGTITGVIAGTDLTGGGTSGNVTLNVDTTKIPQLASANTFTASQTVNGNLSATGAVVGTTISGTSSTVGANVVAGNNSATSGSGSGVYGSTSSPAGTGILGVNGFGGDGVWGQSNGTAAYGAGVLGTSSSASGSAPSYGIYGATANPYSPSAGVYGIATGAGGSGPTYGIYGQHAYGVFGAGTFGQNGSLSVTGQTHGYFSGVWGDGGTSGAYGVLGTADNTSAGYFESDNTRMAGIYTLIAAADSGALPFLAYDNPNSTYCYIDNEGNVNCTGTFNTLDPIDGGARKVALSAIQSPKNWFEDAGAAQLMNGSAVVALDPEFIQTVNTEVDYKVFPVPNGDCKGLYVTKKTSTSFEVRELGGGTSSIRFDYRIMALRKNYENVRFADHTSDPDPKEQILKRRQPGAPQEEPAPPKESALVRSVMPLSIPPSLKKPTALVPPAMLERQEAKQVPQK